MTGRQTTGVRQVLDGVSPVGGLEIDVISEAGIWPSNAEEIVRRAAEHAYVVAGPSQDAELCIVFGDDALVQNLNKTYRHQDKPTNVLSFPTSDIPAITGAEFFSDMAPHLLGDVVLAQETIAREAVEQSKTFSNHLAHLVVHGVLHLLGQDHEDDLEAEEMEAMERDILEDLNIPDPYAADAALNLRNPDA